MNTPGLPDSASKSSKLMIRSEVLAVIRHMVSLVDAPKQERLKQLKRLQDLEPRDQVLDILVKELHRTAAPETIQVITQLLMELGSIDVLHDKLWNIIRDPKALDEIKDTCNLILRHLGDATDPDLYLEYLDDPQGLIGRETVRMLEVSSENPEALVDFIDFILSLTIDDQVRLLSSLQKDYPSEYLVNLYIPMLEADPSPELWEQLITNLGESKSAQAVPLLSRLLQWPEDRLPVKPKSVSKALKQLQIAGVYHPNAPRVELKLQDLTHPLIEETTLYQCFATLSDGIGNQGIILSRQRSNGDISMVSVALNDVHGIIDCFGFYQLSMGDFHRIMEKFHEGATKIKVSPEYCAYKLLLAERMNAQFNFRLPYEYGCWRPILYGINPSPPEELENPSPSWIRIDWYEETANLYQHPDFNSWFLEQGDDPGVTRALQKVIVLAEAYLAENETASPESYYLPFASISDTLILELLNSNWRALMIARLREAAYLLNCQNTHTFRNLAATEMYKLQTVSEPEAFLNGFCQAYGRRCICEELLRLRAGSASYHLLSPLVEGLLNYWKL